MNILQIEKTETYYDGPFIIDMLGDNFGDNSLISQVEEIELSDELGKFKRFIIHFHKSNEILDKIFEHIAVQGYFPIIYGKIFCSKKGYCNYLFWDLTPYKPLIFKNLHA